MLIKDTRKPLSDVFLTVKVLLRQQNGGIHYSVNLAYCKSGENWSKVDRSLITWTIGTCLGRIKTKGKELVQFITSDSFRTSWACESRLVLSCQWPLLVWVLCWFFCGGCGGCGPVVRVLSYHTRAQVWFRSYWRENGIIKLMWRRPSGHGITTCRVLLPRGHETVYERVPIPGT